MGSRFQGPHRQAGAAPDGSRLGRLGRCYFSKYHRAACILDSAVLRQCLYTGRQVRPRRGPPDYGWPCWTVGLRPHEGGHDGRLKCVQKPLLTPGYAVLTRISFPRLSLHSGLAAPASCPLFCCAHLVPGKGRGEEGSVSYTRLVSLTWRWISWEPWSRLQQENGSRSPLPQPHPRLDSVSSVTALLP